MEQETVLKEMLHAFKLYSEKTDKAYAQSTHIRKTHIRSPFNECASFA